MSIFRRTCPGSSSSGSKGWRVKMSCSQRARAALMSISLLWRSGRSSELSLSGSHLSVGSCVSPQGHVVWQKPTPTGHPCTVRHSETCRRRKPQSEEPQCLQEDLQMQPCTVECEPGARSSWRVIREPKSARVSSFTVPGMGLPMASTRAIASQSRIISAVSGLFGTKLDMRSSFRRLWRTSTGLWSMRSRRSARTSFGKANSGQRSDSSR
mmetsp:Transcript_41232/g.122368  ORF Transcript_41232/g.122368 Transcript_41232/m.122368 type:complete len:211 (+) Transcript_41232:217-849(+)